MKKSRFSLQFLLSLLIEVLDYQNTNSLISQPLNILSLVCYFFQLLGFTSKFGFVFSDSKLRFLFNLFYYSNFANLLSIFESRSLVMAVYALVIFLIAGFYLYFAILAFILLQYKIKHHQVMILRVLNGFFSGFFRVFFWLFLLPFLEILINPLKCDVSGSFLNCGKEFSSAMIIPSVIFSLLVILMGFLNLMIHNNYNFLDFHEINLRLNIFTSITFLLRVSIPLFSPFANDRVYILMIILHSFAFICLANFIQNFPIRSPTLNPIYFSLLLSFEMILIVTTFWEYFDVLQEESLFYLITLGFALTFKIGYSFPRSKRLEIFLSNFSYKGFVDYALEEMSYLFHNYTGSIPNFFMMLGMMKFHAKNCVNPVCKLKSKTMKKFQDLSLFKKTKILNGFTVQRFTKEIEKECKNKGSLNETLIFKYISYLIHSNCNTSKAFYETQKIKLLYQNRTFLGQILMNSLLKKVEKKIQELEREKFISKRKTIEQNLEVASFFRVFREKSLMENEAKKILQLKISFWESYKEGFDSYDNLLASFHAFFSEVQAFKAQLQEIESRASFQHEKVILFRFLSFYHSIILNQLPDAIQFDDQIDTIRKKFLHIEKDKLSPLMFLKENIVVCEASFLNCNGNLLESSKTLKLANFFGYSLEDLKVLNSIESFMPNYIKDKHQKLIFWSFEKTRREQITYDFEVYTHAMDKEGFLFPIKLFLGFNFHYVDDYVANAGILKLQESSIEEVLIDPQGEILGFNREFFELFKREYPSITLERMKRVCLFSILPRVKEILEREGIFKDRKTIPLRNQICVMLLPENLEEVMDLLRFYRAEIEALTDPANHSSHGFSSSYSTFKTNRSLNSNNLHKTSSVGRTLKQNKDFFIRLNHFLANTHTLKLKREHIINLFQDHSLTSEDIFNKVIDHSQVFKTKVVLSITFRYHKYGKAPNDVISIGQVAFSKIGKIEKNEKEAQPLRKHKVVDESFFSENQPIVLPPQNQPEFGIEFERLLVTNQSIRSQQNTEKLNAIDANYSNFSVTAENNDLKSAGDSNRREPNVKFNISDPKPGNDFLLHPENIAKERLFHNQEPRKSEKLVQKNSRSTIKSSEENKDKGKNQTTEQIFLKELEIQGSQKSTSTNTGKTAFSVLSIVSLLQKALPKSIFRLIYLLLAEIALILVFGLTYYLFAGQYISGYYIPLKVAITNQLELTTSIISSATVCINLENFQSGIKQPSEFDLTEMFTTIDAKYSSATSIFYKDRNSESSFQFTPAVRAATVTYVDPNSFSAERILFVDAIDIFLNLLNTIKSVRDVDSLKTILKVLPRNIIDFAEITRDLRNLMANEFLKSNEKITSNLLVILIISLSLVSLGKFIEYAILVGFYAKTTRLLNIFLRNTMKEAINEIFFLKETLEILKDETKSYMGISFSDKVLTKRNYALDNEDELGKLQLKAKLKDAKKIKKVKSRLSTLQPFSRIKIFAFLILSGGSVILYFSFNYYFWMTCNNNIETLLTKTQLINNLYLYSVSIPLFNNLLLREIIRRDPDYEQTNATYQIHENRLRELTRLLNSRLSYMEAALAILPTYMLVAEQDLNDPVFTSIVQGNLCDVLFQNGRIDDWEISYCINCFDGAMTKGILGALNQFLNILKANKNLADYSQASITDIKAFISGDVYSEIINASFYLNDALQDFYDYFSQYYLNQLYANIEQLTIFVWTMCTFCMVGMIALSIHSWKFLRRMYALGAGSLGIIPLEKLSFDEQTIFLIKNFYKEQI